MTEVKPAKARATSKCCGCRKPIRFGEWYVMRDAGYGSPDRFCKTCALKWPDERIQAAAKEI